MTAQMSGTSPYWAEIQVYDQHGVAMSFGLWNTTRLRQLLYGCYRVGVSKEEENLSIYIDVAEETHLIIGSETLLSLGLDQTVITARMPQSSWTRWMTITDSNQISISFWAQRSSRVSVLLRACWERMTLEDGATIHLVNESEEVVDVDAEIKGVDKVLYLRGGVFSE